MPESSWSRADKLAAGALAIGGLSLAAALLVVPEVRSLFNLAGDSRSPFSPAIATVRLQESTPSVPSTTESRKADEMQITRRAPAHEHAQSESTSAADLAPATRAETVGSPNMTAQMAMIPVAPASPSTASIGHSQDSSAPSGPPSMDAAASVKTTSQPSIGRQDTTQRESPPEPNIQERPIRQFVGKWSGNVRQQGLQPYTVVLTIYDRDVGDVGQIDYAQLGCGGKLTFVGASRGVLQVSEVLSYGLNRCIVGGLITIEMKGEGVSVFTWSNGTAIYDASATVFRR